MLNCEPASLTVFTTMFPKEQQTSDNLIVIKDYCFIIEIFDKEPVKLIKQVKIVYLSLQSMSDQFHVIILRLPM